MRRNDFEKLLSCLRALFIASLLNFTLQEGKLIFNEANLIDRVIIDTDPCQSKHGVHNNSFLFGSRVNTTPGSVTRNLHITP